MTVGTVQLATPDSTAAVTGVVTGSRSFYPGYSCSHSGKCQLFESRSRCRRGGVETMLDTAAAETVVTEVTGSCRNLGRIRMDTVTAAIVGEVDSGNGTIRLGPSSGGCVGAVAVVAGLGTRRCFQTTDIVISMTTLAIRCCTSGNRIGIGTGVGMTTGSNTGPPRRCPGCNHVQSARVRVGMAASRINYTVHMLRFVNEDIGIGGTSITDVTVTTSTRCNRK